MTPTEPSPKAAGEMTDTSPSVVEVEQCDRDAAAALLDRLGGIQRFEKFGISFAAMNNAFCGALAAHRLAECARLTLPVDETELVERMRAWPATNGQGDALSSTYVGNLLSEAGALLTEKDRVIREARERLDDFCQAAEYWAGCDEGCDESAATSEIMRSGGAWPSLAYEKSRHFLSKGGVSR